MFLITPRKDSLVRVVKYNFMLIIILYVACLRLFDDGYYSHYSLTDYTVNEKNSRLVLGFRTCLCCNSSNQPTPRTGLIITSNWLSITTIIHHPGCRLIDDYGVWLYRRLRLHVSSSTSFIMHRSGLPVLCTIASTSQSWTWVQFPKSNPIQSTNFMTPNPIQSMMMT